MPILNVTGPFRIGGGDEDRRHSLNDRYDVMADNNNEPIPGILGAVGVPALFSNHPTETGYNLARRNVGKRTGPLSEVICEYVKVVSGGNPNGFPWQQPFEKAFSFGATTEQFDYTLNGEPVQNSAQQAFETPLADDLYEMDVTYTQNYLSFPDSDIATLAGAVNADPFDGRPAGVCKIVGLGGRDLLFGEQLYRQVSWTVRTRRPRVQQPMPGGVIGGPLRAWWKRVLDQGYNELIASDAQTGQPIHRAFKTQDGELLLRNLDGTGGGAQDNAAFWLEFQSPFAPVLSYSALALFWPS